MNRSRSIAALLLAAFVIGSGAVAYWYQTKWSAPSADIAESARPALSNSTKPSDKVLVSEQAQKNLGLTAKPLQAGVFWKTVTMQGMVADLPGHSDREVVAPVTGVISQLFHGRGDMVRPGEKLLTLKLASGSLQQTQADLAKTSEETKQARARLERLTGAGEAIARARVIEVQNEISRLEVAAQGYRQELRNRGLSEYEIDNVADGKVISEIAIVVPPRALDQAPLSATPGSTTTPVNRQQPAYEVQQLEVELGEQVQAGQTLFHLSNHKLLSIEGRAFREETTLLERSVQEHWPVEVNFQEEADTSWPPIEQAFYIRYIANTIDPVTRTFAFAMPLKNQYKTVEHDDKQQLLWRFRPGQRVLLRVRTEVLNDVFVLPADAVVMEGADAYVFTQNVNTFERKGVHVLYRDRDRVVVANDGSLPTYKKGPDVLTIPAIARTAAAQLNRMSKAGSSDVPKGYHIHADGSLHKNEDESK